MSEMVHICLYNELGAIEVIKLIEKGMEELNSSGYSYIVMDEALPNYHEYYVSNGEVLPRPRMDLVVTQNPFTITNVPANTEVSYPGGTVVIDDGYLEWDATVPGEYPFYLNNFPYQEEVVNAEITDV